MKVHVIGGAPAGRSFSIVMKKAGAPTRFNVLE
jgi:flavin-dependent dehydrogenase